MKLDRAQNEAIRVVLGTTESTPTGAMPYLMDLPSVDTGQKVKQVNPSQYDADSKIPLYDVSKVKKK